MSIFNISNIPDNASSDAILEDSFQSVSELPTPSFTPTPKPPDKESGRSKAASSRSGVKLKCPNCPSYLANKSTLDTHMRGHVMKGIRSCGPSLQDVIDNLPKLICDALYDMLKEVAFGDLGKLYKSSCELLKECFSDQTDILNDFIQFLSEPLHSVLQCNKILFPSAIRSNAYKGTNAILNTVSFRNTLKVKLRTLIICPDNILSLFAGNLFFCISRKLAVYAITKMRGNIEKHNVRKKRSDDDPNSLTFQQLVYDIGSSIVSGYLWKGNQYSETSETWSLYVQVLKSKLLRNDNNQCHVDVRAHTESKDRGGLKHISNEALDFFVVLFDTIMSSEGENGSFPLDVINGCVLSNDVVLCLWDVLVGNDLQEDQALDLLLRVTESCTKVVVKGAIKRHLNELFKQSYSSVALRAKLAR